MSLVEKAEKWSHANGTRKEMLTNDLLKLILYDKQQDREKTLKLGTQLLNFETHFTPRELNHILGILYNTYRHLDAYDEIIKLIPLFEKYEKIDKGWRIKGFTTRYDLAMINYKVENYKQAANDFLKQKKIFDSIGNQLYVSSMSNNIGLCYYQLKDYNKALKFYNKALLELKTPNKNGIEEEPDSYKEYFEMVIKGNIANIDFDTGNYTRALQIYTEQHKASKGVGEFPIQSNIFINLSRTYLARNNATKANQYADSAIASINKYIDSETRIDIYTNKGKALLIAGSPKLSFIYFNKADQINDSVKQLKISRDNLVEKVKYEMGKKDEDLQKAKQTVLLKEKIATQQNFVIWITTFLILLISYLYYKSRKNKNIIEAQREVLQSSVQEKEVLLKEVHHRVKNNLQVISGLLQLQSKKIKNKEMLQLVEETQSHISSIATIHEMLYRQEDSATISIAEYLHKLANELKETYTKCEIQISIKAPNVHLSINKAIPIGLIVNELITNSFKYAFEKNKGHIAIEIIEKQKKEFHFTYRDDGKGLPPDYEKNIPDTMGFRLINMLAEEMDGTMNIYNGKGLKIEIQFIGL